MWHPYTTSPPRMGDYQVGWYSQPTPACPTEFVQQVAGYSPAHGWLEHADRVQYWAPLRPAPGPPANLCTSLAEWLAALGFRVEDDTTPDGRVVRGAWQSRTGATYELAYTWAPDSPLHGSCELRLHWPSGHVTRLFEAHRVGTLEQARAQLLGSVHFYDAYRQAHPDFALF